MATPTLRRETAGLVTLAERDLATLWQSVSAGASAEVALRDLLPAIIATYGEAGAALAADWYDDQRAKVGAPGRFTAIPVEADDRGAHALIGWALTEARDDTSLSALIAGGVQRRIADHVRDTIATSATRDPGARGWQRVGDGSCAFCRMLIHRGAVYSAANADFASHDHCNCSATPAWQNAPIPVKPYTRSAKYVEDDAIRAKQNAKLRAYIKARGY